MKKKTESDLKRLVTAKLGKVKHVVDLTSQSNKVSSRFEHGSEKERSEKKKNPRKFRV